MAQPDQISIALSPAMAAELQEAVDAGEYASIGEAIGNALQAWRENRRNELRALIADGIESGPSLDASEVFAGLRAQLRALPAA